MRASSTVAPLVTIAATIGLIVTAIKLVLRLPGIPYNVKELFLNNASVTALAFFALAVLWIGAGAMLLAQVVSRSRRPYLVLPVAAILISLVSKLLLSRSVTDESIDDIVGVNTLFGWVTYETIWGTAWKQAFL